MPIKYKFENLSDMIRSTEYEHFESDRLGNGLFISNLNRAERIHEYAENGSNGSTHEEIIDDWKDFLNNLSIQFRDDIDEDTQYDISEDTFDLIEKEIEECREWHRLKGSIEQIIN